MSEPVMVVRHGHPTFLKWHRARRRASDPVFTGKRILEGMALGASVEVDLVVHADRGFAVLHELMLGIETTGSGAVHDTNAATLRTLNLRDNHGAPIDDKVMLLEDLTALMAKGQIHPNALLQLDYKEDVSVLDLATVANFAQAVAPVARNMILSSGDANSVRVLTNASPGVRVGYDPCHGDVLSQLVQTRDFKGFVADAVDASPNAELIYLAYELVIDAADAGFDVVRAFHNHSRRIDAYTIQAANAHTKPTVERLLELNVDQITTDDPEGLMALVG